MSFWRDHSACHVCVVGTGAACQGLPTCGGAGQHEWSGATHGGRSTAGDERHPATRTRGRTERHRRQGQSACRSPYVDSRSPLTALTSIDRFPAIPLPFLQEIAKLKEVAQRTNDIRRLDAEIARIRANYDRRQRDIQESRARKDQAEVLLERVVAQTEQREQQLEEARVRATTVNTELATVTRKLHRQENKLAADLARAKAVSGAGKEAGDGEAAVAAAGKGKGKGKAKKGKVDVEALESQHRALVKDNAGMLAELTALRAQVERLTQDNERLSREVGPMPFTATLHSEYLASQTHGVWHRDGSVTSPRTSRCRKTRSSRWVRRLCVLA